MQTYLRPSSLVLRASLWHPASLILSEAKDLSFGEEAYEERLKFLRQAGLLTTDYQLRTSGC